jgi:CheY-like chemotaxis protein
MRCHADGTRRPGEEGPIHRTLGARETVSGEELFWRADGSCFAVSCSVALILHGDAVLGAVLSFEDIGARKRAEVESLRAKAEAEAAGEGFDLVLADWLMPGMDGLELGPAAGQPAARASPGLPAGLRADRRALGGGGGGRAAARPRPRRGGRARRRRGRQTRGQRGP